MKFIRAKFVLLLCFFLLFASSPLLAVNKEIVQLQTQVQDLANLVQKLQQSNDERMGVVKSLIEQNTDTVNKLTSALGGLQKSLQQQLSDTQGKIDQVSGQIQALNDAVEELKARNAKLQKQLADIAAQQGNAAAAAPSAAQQQAPPADVLYSNAQRDYTAGRYDLAQQQFADFLKYYANNDQAGSAQFFLADIEYRQGNFEAAAKDFDKVLEQYPGGAKTPAAQLKKAFSLLELGQKEAGVKELKSLATRYPHSLEAQEAQDRLKKLGVAAGAARRR